MDTRDVEIVNEGTVVLFRPVTDRAKVWFKENIQAEGWQWLGMSVGVDHRYAGDIVEGLLGAGFNLQ